MPQYSNISSAWEYSMIHNVSGIFGLTSKMMSAGVC